MLYNTIYGRTIAQNLMQGQSVDLFIARSMQRTFLPYMDFSSVQN